MNAGMLFCQYIDPGLHGILIPLIFTASFVAFLWAVAYYAFEGEYDEYAREMSKGLMLWSILAFLFMVVVWGILEVIYDYAGLSSAVC